MRYQLLHDTLQQFKDFSSILDAESNRRTPAWDTLNHTFQDAHRGYYPFLLSRDHSDRWIVIAEADTVEELKLKVSYLFL